MNQPIGIAFIKQLLQRLQHSRTPGQSLVEMAIITPLLIFFLLGIFEVGSGIRGYLVLVNVNREITRFAVRPGYLNFSTLADVEASYTRVQEWTTSSASEQLELDFDETSGSTTLIVSHLVVDTGKPCDDVNNCDCDAFIQAYQNGSTYAAEASTGAENPLDDLILHPGVPGQEYQSRRFGPAATVTGPRQTRLDYIAIATEMAAKNNHFNCEIMKKGGVPSANNVIITELFHDQPQLFGFPLISNPFTDPVPLYTHTTMRLISAARSTGGVEGNITSGIDTIGPVCMAYPITFGQSIFDNPDNPSVPQFIDAFEGDSPGNFGWITWNPDPGNNNANYVEDELKYPQMSLNDFTDVNDPSDHQLSIGDDVSTKPGVANSSGIDEQLQLLVGREIIIPVYDNNPGNGQNAFYHISHFAKIRVDQICLPRNGSKCDGQNNKQIKATFLGYVDDICGTDDGSGGIIPGGGSGGGNTPPLATDDSASTPKNTPVTLNVLVNDSDPDGDTLTITGIQISPSDGSAANNGDGTITFTPKNNATGVKTFTYTISDGNGGSDTATVTITIGGSNNPPVAVNDSTTTTQNLPVTINVLANDSDPDGDTITVQSVAGPAHGNAVVNGNGTITYTPSNGYSGPDSFTYTISDGNGGAASAIVSITVNPTHTPTPTPTFTPTPTPTNTPSPTPSPTATPSPTPTANLSTMHVASIDVTVDRSCNRWVCRYEATAVVTVVNGSGMPINGVTVQGHWSDAVSGSDSDGTNGNGQAVFRSDETWWDGTFTFTVDNLTAGGLTYNPGANAESSDSAQYN